VGIDETVSPGGNSLQYDAGLDIYSYIWKTEKSWAGTCRQLIFQFADATVNASYRQKVIVRGSRTSRRSVRL
jgi:hypothetical protein